MPTKINKSPLTVIPPQLIAMGVKGLAGGVGEVLKQSRAAKDSGEKYDFLQGLGDFGQGTATGLTGVDFTDQEQAPEDIVRSVPAEWDNENPSSNQVPTSGTISPEGNPAVVQGIDPAQSQLGGLFAPTPIKMSEPRTKNISPVEMNYAPLKMSANQVKQAGLMMNISGASSLSPVTYGDEENKEKPKEYLLPEIEVRSRVSSTGNNKFEFTDLKPSRTPNPKAKETTSKEIKSIISNSPSSREMEVEREEQDWLSNQNNPTPDKDYPNFMKSTGRFPKIYK